MDPRLQRRVQRYGWDRAAASYERYWREQLAPAQDKLIELAAPRAGERFLDVACGTGLVTLPLARAVGPTGAVVATDIAEVMVTAVTAEAARLGLDQISARRVDAEALDFPDDAFDAAVCALGLMYVPDPSKALHEMARVVRPGGRVVAAVWGRRDRCGWAEIFPIVDSRVASEVCPMFFQLGTGNTLGNTMSAAGLADINVVRLSSVLRYASEDEACGAAFAGGPVALAYSRFDEDTRRAAHEEYLQSIEPFRLNGGYEVPGEFVVAAGVVKP